MMRDLASGQPGTLCYLYFVARKGFRHISIALGGSVQAHSLHFSAGSGLGGQDLKSWPVERSLKAPIQFCSMDVSWFFYTCTVDLGALLMPVSCAKADASSGCPVRRVRCADWAWN